MKNPNGYGSVSKLSGNRRKPFWVRKTIGWNEKGHPIYETIGYCKTREEGNILLADYNRNPWDVDRVKITLQELFDLWIEKKSGKLGKSNLSSLKSAYKHINKLSGMKYKDIRSYHMQDCIDGCGCGYSTQGAIKNLWGHLDRFALELDVITRMYSELLTSAPIPQTSRDRFSDEEISKVWELYESHDDRYQADIVLIFLYSGFRISELFKMKKTDIDLEKGTFQGGVKTKAGKDRIVPIHSLIVEMVKDRLSSTGDYFLTIEGRQLKQTTFRENYWKPMMEHLNMNHTPHECRHTFESVLDSKGANRKCIDMMMGHVSKDVGNRVYNHKTLEELKEAIELLDRPLNK